MNKSNLNTQSLIFYFSIILIVVTIISLSIGYLIGKNNSKTSSKESLLTEVKQTPTSPPTNSPIPTPYIISTTTTSPNTSTNNITCSKYGFAQKWEYLTAYIIKENDSLTSIAKIELKDETRVNEILKINGANQLIVGSTLYLPPPSITKSSGNLKQVYGKLIGKDSSYWNVLLSSDPKGQSILMPSFIFEKVSNKNDFKVGDCIKVFLDDGYEAYTVTTI